MSFTTWGQTATHSTTVSASPTPTTTSCTVASAGSFREGMAVYFDVSGTPTRTFLTGITGNALTFSPPLSSAPDVGGDAVSYHQPIFNDKLNESALWREATTTSLRAVDTTGMPDGTRVIVEDVGIYRLDTAGAGSDDDHKIIDPTTGPGRWFLEVFGPEWVQDTNWISSFPTSDGANYQHLATNGAGVISFQSPANGPQKFTQASHGFAAKDMIRHNGTDWVKAQGDTIVKCTGAWLVMAVDGNDFIAVKSGRVTVSGHGLTAGSLYYLSAASAGALTTTKPVGDTTTPLGFFLPAVYVESSSVLHVLGQQYPTFNPILARYVNAGSNADTITFSNLDLVAYGGSVGFEIGVGSATNSGSGGEFQCRINGSSSVAYDYAANWDTGSAWTRQAGANQTQWTIARPSSFSGFDEPLFVSGKVALSDVDGSASFPMFNSEFTHKTGMGISRGQYVTSVSNITSITFGIQGTLTWRASQSHYANLLWNGKIS